MKILYGIQGTGNGHISRALEIVPLLQKRAEVDVLISGSEWELSLPFPVKYRMNGLGFIFGKKGGVDIMQTYLKMNAMQLRREIKSLSLKEYDLIISDFEPITCWASRMQKRVCVGLSNQSVTLHPLAPKPESSDTIGKLVLEHYAPCTHNYGFHFKRFDESVYTPIIRKEVREEPISNKGHITVYLPSFDDERILHKLRHFSKVEFQVFSKHIKSAYREKNFWVFPLNSKTFIRSMASSNGVLCNAGFGTAAEALYLGKKMLVIPMKTQYEQACNAEVLKSMGVTVIKNLKKKNYEIISSWLSEGTPIHVAYSDETVDLLDLIISRHAGKSIDNKFNSFGHDIFNNKLFPVGKFAASS